MFAIMHHKDLSQAGKILTDKHERMKADLIGRKLIEKGFPDLVNMGHALRFHKVIQIVKNGWTYVFAENGTKQGYFIVAVKAPELSEDTNIVTSTLKWQDTDFSEVAL